MNEFLFSYRHVFVKKKNDVDDNYDKKKFCNKMIIAANFTKMPVYLYLYFLFFSFTGAKFWEPST